MIAKKTTVACSGMRWMPPSSAQRLVNIRRVATWFSQLNTGGK